MTRGRPPGARIALQIDWVLLISSELDGGHCNIIQHKAILYHTIPYRTVPYPTLPYRATFCAQIYLRLRKTFYLGSIVRYDGGAGIGIQSGLNKARTSFKMLNNVWRSSQYGTRTKLKIYHSCVLSTLLYGSECWRMTESDLR